MPKKLNMNRVHNPIYWEQVAKKLRHANAKKESFTFRRKMLDDQKRNNYSNEYDRIRGILLHSSLPAVTMDALKKRKEHLKALGGKAFTLD